MAIISQCDGPWPAFDESSGLSYGLGIQPPENRWPIPTKDPLNHISRVHMSIIPMKSHNSHNSMRFSPHEITWKPMGFRRLERSNSPRSALQRFRGLPGGGSGHLQLQRIGAAAVHHGIWAQMAKPSSTFRWSPQICLIITCYKCRVPFE